MALVKFYRGNYAKYNKTAHEDGVYFAIDKQLILMNGVEYGGVNMHDFEGFIKDADVEGQTLTFKKNVIDAEGAPKWEDVSIQLIAAADNSIELGTITKEGVNDGSTIKVKLAAHTDEDGLVVKEKTDGSEGGLYVDLTKTNAAIKANKDAIEAMDLTDTLTAGSFVTKVDQVDGKITVSKAAVASADKTITITTDAEGSIDLKANIDGKTIIADKENGTLSVDSSVLTQYVGENAISVSAVDETNNTKAISLTIDAADKVLSQSTSGLLASISMSYDSTNKKIYLYGKDASAADKAISTIDASDFIKDGMLSNVEYKTEGDGHAAADGPYLVFTWNTDSGVTTPMWVSLKGLVDVYQAGDGLKLDTNTFSVRKDESSEDFLSVSENGVKVSGVQNAIDAAKAEAKSVVAVKANEAHLEIATATDAADNHVTYTLNTKDVASADDLTNEIAARKAVDGQNGDTYAANTNATYIKEATSLNDADVKLDAAVDALEKALTWIDLD